MFKRSGLDVHRQRAGWKLIGEGQMIVRNIEGLGEAGTGLAGDGRIDLQAGIVGGARGDDQSAIGLEKLVVLGRGADALPIGGSAKERDDDLRGIVRGRIDLGDAFGIRGQNRLTIPPLLMWQYGITRVRPGK